MSKELKLNVAAGVSELIVRHGEAEKVHVPGKITIENGTIGSVVEYLTKQGIDANEIQNSYVGFSYEQLYIRLGYAQRRVNPDYVGGVLKLHPDLSVWDINGKKTYTTFSLADFIKLNRHYFESKDVAMKLVSELRDFKANVDKKIEASNNQRGNARVLVAQVAESNIPESFALLLPVFVGTEPVRVDVEININADDFSCNLISPDLKKVIDLETKKIIDEQLDQIKKLQPELRIFQF